MSSGNRSPKQTRSLSAIRRRLSIVRRLDDWLEIPMALLSAVWLYLMVVEFVRGLNRFGEAAFSVIWIVFIIDFLVRFAFAPRKLRYLRGNWLTALSLLLPALRIFRIGRVFHALARLKGLQLVRVVGSINRGMKALKRTMNRRGFGYVAALTVIVTLAGAAGMYHFERDLGRPDGLNDYWTALWWTAMIITTMGSAYWPQTPEGRMLCLLLAVYAFSIFGYFTGVIATYFIDRDAADDSAEVIGRKDIEALRHDIAGLRAELRGEREGEAGNRGTRTGTNGAAGNS